MIDTYKELYITRKTTPQDKLIGYGAGTLLLLLGVLCLGLGVISSLLFWLGALVCFAGAWLCRLVLNREYDYLYVNGEIEIDVVRGKKRRKHLKTIKCSQMVSLSPGKERKTYRPKGAVKDYTSMDAGIPFAEMTYAGNKGNEILLLELSEDILADLRARYPRQVERY